MVTEQQERDAIQDNLTRLTAERNQLVRERDEMLTELITLRQQNASMSMRLTATEQYSEAGYKRLAAVTAERDELRAQLTQERALMNLVPEYVQYLAKWRAGDGSFLLFNEWVAQRVATPL